jgi:hypothetical protein
MDVSRLEDQEGMRLPDPEAAWYHCIRSAREAIDVELKAGAMRPGRLVDVVDEDGDQVWEMPFEEVLSLAI